jgi:hypothetical protein
MVESFGTKVITSKQKIKISIKGNTALPISTRDLLMIAIETKRFSPKGGVRNPHSMFTIMMIP